MVNNTLYQPIWYSARCNIKNNNNSKTGAVLSFGLITVVGSENISGFNEKLSLMKTSLQTRYKKRSQPTACCASRHINVKLKAALLSASPIGECQHRHQEAGGRHSLWRCLPPLPGTPLPKEEGQEEGPLTPVGASRL